MVRKLAFLALIGLLAAFANVGGAHAQNYGQNQLPNGLTARGAPATTDIVPCQPSGSDVEGCYLSEIQNFTLTSPAQSPATVANGGTGETTASAALVNLSGLPHVANKAALSALASTTYPAVVRDGYATAGDSPPLEYIPSGSGCSISGGDGGSEVPTSDGKCWIASFPSSGADPREWGATCGSADSTAALQAAFTAMATVYKGGTVLVTCPITIASGNVTIPGSVTLAGMGMYSPGMLAATNPASGSWPVNAGSAINCTSTANPCILVGVGAQGVTIRDINLGNPQPTPPSSGTYAPTVFPFVISTSCPSGTVPFSGLTIQNVSITNAYDGIDLEGCATYANNYSQSSGMFYLDNIWFNNVWHYGIYQHLIDQAIRIKNVEFQPLWYFGNQAIANYVEANAVDFYLKYVAAPIYDSIDFFGAKYGIEVENDTVVNGLGTLTVGCTACMVSNSLFDQVCSAVYTSGNSTNVDMRLSNVTVWGDQNPPYCATGTAAFELPTNSLTLQLANVTAYLIDTLGDFGCGAAGSGSCPSGASGGSANVMLSDIEVHNYATWTSAAPLIKMPSLTKLVADATVPAFAHPNSGATGVLFSAGLDGSTGYPLGFTAGGGVNPAEGSVTMAGSGGCNVSGNVTGCLSFSDKGGVERGYIGLGTSSVVDAIATGSGGVTIGNQSAAVNIGVDSGGKVQINAGSLPTSCTGEPTGTLYNSGGAIHQC